MLSLFYSSTTSRFQSTPSEGRATQSLVRLPGPVEFQSTPSEGRATFASLAYHLGVPISIHALRGEGDSGSRYGG